MVKKRVVFFVSALLEAASWFFFGSSERTMANESTGAFVRVVSYAENALTVAEWSDEFLRSLCVKYQVNPQYWHRFTIIVNHYRGEEVQGRCYQSERESLRWVSKIEILENFPDTYHHSLPHELSHAWIHYILGMNVPLFFDESLATANESSKMKRVYLDNLEQFGSTGAVFDLNRLAKWNIDAGRANPLTNRQFYAAAAGVAFYLESWGGKPRYLRFVGKITEGATVDSALNEFYGIGIERFNRDWNRWILNGCPIGKNGHDKNTNGTNGEE